MESALEGGAANCAPAGAVAATTRKTPARASFRNIRNPFDNLGETQAPAMRPVRSKKLDGNCWSTYSRAANRHANQSTIFNVQNRAPSGRMDKEPILPRNDDKRLTPTQIEVPKWSARQFEQQVLDSHPRVAVFDCDGTLWSGDSGYGFMVWSIEQGLVSRSTSDWIDDRHRAYRAGEVSEIEICGEMVQIYEGLRDNELRVAAAQYVNEFVRPRIFAEMVDLVVALK